MYPFTRIRNPGGSTIYRSHVFPARKTKQQDFNVTLVTGRVVGGEGNFQQVYTTDPRPPVGARVSAVVEIMDNQVQHRVPWARLSTVGVFRNWKNANALGIRYEWQEKGKTMSMPVQSMKGYSVIPANAAGTDAAIGAQRNYLLAEGLRRFLEQKTVVNAPSWFENYGIARVLEVKYDHLMQEIIMEEVYPTQGPTDFRQVQNFYLSDDEIKQALHAEGFPLDRIDVKNDVLENFRARKACDRCYGLHKIHNLGVSVSIRECSDVSPGQPCPNCKAMGMLCTFTHGDVLRASPRLQAAVTYLPAHEKMKKGEYRFIEQIANSLVIEGV